MWLIHLRDASKVYPGVKPHFAFISRCPIPPSSAEASGVGCSSNWAPISAVSDRYKHSCQAHLSTASTFGRTINEETSLADAAAPCLFSLHFRPSWTLFPWAPRRKAHRSLSSSCATIMRRFHLPTSRTMGIHAASLFRLLPTHLR